MHRPVVPVDLQPVGGGRITVESVGHGPDPQLAVGILGNAQHPAVDGLAVSVRASKWLKAPRLGIVDVDSVVQRDPHTIVTAYQQPADTVARHPAVVLTGIVVFSEIEPVEAVEPVVGPEPDEAQRILHDAVDPVRREPVLHHIPPRYDAVWGAGRNGRGRRKQQQELKDDSASHGQFAVSENKFNLFFEKKLSWPVGP